MRHREGGARLSVHERRYGAPERISRKTVTHRWVGGRRIAVYGQSPRRYGWRHRYDEPDYIVRRRRIVRHYYEPDYIVRKRRIVRRYHEEAPSYGYRASIVRYGRHHGHGYGGGQDRARIDIRSHSRSSQRDEFRSRSGRGMGAMERHQGPGRGDMQGHHGRVDTTGSLRGGEAGRGAAGRGAGPAMNAGDHGSRMPAGKGSGPHGGGGAAPGGARP